MAVASLTSEVPRESNWGLHPKFTLPRFAHCEHSPVNSKWDISATPKKVPVVKRNDRQPASPPKRLPPTPNAIRLIMILLCVIEHYTCQPC